MISSWTAGLSRFPRLPGGQAGEMAQIDHGAVHQGDGVGDGPLSVTSASTPPHGLGPGRTGRGGQAGRDEQAGRDGQGGPIRPQVPGRPWVR